MTIATAFTNFARSALRHSRERYAHRQTLQAVSELPPHVLKDIGWPDSYERRSRH